MDISQFLAKLIGLYFVIGTGLWFIRHKKLKQATQEVMGSKAVLAISGEVSLIFGLVVVLDHSIWELDYKGLITFLGYLLVLRGILRLGFPERCKKIMDGMSEGQFKVFLLLSFLVGAYLTYCGFYNP
jgi:uncharacterized protein YjeT (DUF2065 family)